MKICPNCSEAFLPAATAQIYCCKGCRRKADKKRQRLVEAAKAAEQRLERTGLLKDEKMCTTCSVKFKFDYGGQKYCSNTCKMEATTKSKEARLRKEKEERAKLGPKLKRCECRQCGKVFFSERKLLLCSDECRKVRERSSYKKRLYGISDSQYDKMLVEQEAKCLICRQIKRLVIDHCHVNGHARGLLCSNCNSGIGLLGDNVTNLENAVLYLRERGTPQ
jgi:hypothetical protein